MSDRHSSRRTTDSAAAKHVLKMNDLTGIIDDVVRDGLRLKTAVTAGNPVRELPGKTLAMYFEKPSTRTRVSYETGMTQLGGHAIMLSPEHMQLGRGEPISDTSRVLSRYTDGIMARVNSHETIEELAAYSSVPVINGLSDKSHPSQAIADLLTIKEVFGGFSDVNVTWVGDGNNVAASFAIGSSMVGIDLTVASPKAYQLDEEVLAIAAEHGSPPTVTDDPVQAVSGADIVYTDVWVSMGNEAERDDRLVAFDGYQVNESLLSHAPDALVMHCLPAHRGEEITSTVLEGERSLVWDQAENRLHAQNGLLVNLLA